MMRTTRVGSQTLFLELCFLVTEFRIILTRQLGYFGPVSSLQSHDS